MRAGRLDRKITIQTLTLSQDATGDSVDTPSTFAEVWAEKVENDGSESIAAAKVEGKHMVVFNIRYLSGLTTSHRISYDSKIYDILDVSEIGRRDGMKITAKTHD